MVGVSYAELWSSGIHLIEMDMVFIGMRLGLFSVVNFQAELGLFNDERDLFLAGSVCFLHRKTLLRGVVSENGK